jgi:predicted porin
MKKSLYSTTFLATAGVLALSAGDAYAQAAAPAAEKLKISIGGYMLQLVGWAEQDGDFERAVAGNANGRKQFDVKSDSEIYFSGSVKLDNGMTVSVMSQLETQRSTGGNVTNDFIDESYMTINTGYGDIKLGYTDSVGGTLGVQGPTVGMQNPLTTDQDAWVIAPAAVVGNSLGTNFGGGNDDNRVTYISPSLAGFRAGASFTPDSTTQSETQPAASTQGDSWDVAAQYSGKFDAVAFRVSADYFRTRGVTETGSTSNWGIGADVTFADFTVGAGYRETDEDGSGLAAGTTSASYDVWNVGVKYAPGPYALGVFYGRSEAPATSGDADDNSHSRLSIGAEYTMGPGVTVGANFFRHEWENEANTAATENDAWGIVGGIKVDF